MAYEAMKAEEARQGQVSEQLGQLKGAIDVLSDTIKNIEERLRPILRPKKDDESKPDAPQLVVPLADKINTQMMRVAHQTERLSRILERLEL